MVFLWKGDGMMNNRAIETAKKAKEELAKLYDVPVSSIVWKGDNKYILVKNGKEYLVKLILL